MTEHYYAWVKKLGQWHLADKTGCLCGQAMLGNNYADVIPESERTKCEKCWAEMVRREPVSPSPRGVNKRG